MMDVNSVRGFRNTYNNEMRPGLAVEIDGQHYSISRTLTVQTPTEDDIPVIETRKFIGTTTQTPSRAQGQVYADISTSLVYHTLCKITRTYRIEKVGINHQLVQTTAIKDYWLVE